MVKSNTGTTAIGGVSTGDILYRVISQAAMIYKPPYCLKGSTCEVSTVAPIITQKGFVVANRQSAYPKKGFAGDGNYKTGGDWYELIGQVASTNALSLTDDATNLIKNIAVEEIKREVILNVD